MKYSTKSLLRTAVRRAWIAVLAGILLAGCFFLLKGRNHAEPEPEAPAESAVPTEVSKDPRMNRFALYRPDFTGYAEHAEMGMDEYAQSLSTFVAFRFQTDAAFWSYYESLLDAYPTLDTGVFTSDVMRAMIGIWQYGYDVVLRVTSPIINHSQLAHYAEALHLDADAPDLMAQVQCLLRDRLFSIVTANMDDPASLEADGVSITRTKASYEQMMAAQSVVASEQNAGIPQRGEGSNGVGKKTLLLVFLLGFVLAEAIVLALALLDGKIRSAEELELNTDLPLLGTVKSGAPDYAEPALRLTVRKAEPGALVLAALQADSDLSAAAGELTAALKSAAQKAGLTVSGEIQAVGSAASWNPALASAIGKEIILVAEAGKSSRRALADAAEILRSLELPVVGVLYLEP